MSFFIGMPFFCLSDIFFELVMLLNQEIFILLFRHRCCTYLF